MSGSKHLHVHPKARYLKLAKVPASRLGHLPQRKTQAFNVSHSKPRWSSLIAGALKASLAGSGNASRSAASPGSSYLGLLVLDRSVTQPSRGPGPTQPTHKR